jgi:hypothetical protein
MTAKPITAQEMADSILKIMDEVALDYPEKDREKLKAVMLGQLGMALFNGPDPRAAEKLELARHELQGAVSDLREGGKVL